MFAISPLHLYQRAYPYSGVHWQLHVLWWNCPDWHQRRIEAEVLLWSFSLLCSEKMDKHLCNNSCAKPLPPFYIQGFLKGKKNGFCYSFLCVTAKNSNKPDECLSSITSRVDKVYLRFVPTLLEKLWNTEHFAILFSLWIALSCSTVRTWEHASM